MPTTDFTAWATPDLVLTLGGRTYRVPPPSVDQAAVLLALAVAEEHRLGVVRGPIPDDVQAIVDEADKQHLADISLGEEAHKQLVADGVDRKTILRMAYYAVLYGARGKAWADQVAVMLWAPDPAEQEGEGDPKAG